jgi:hypothetical protein
MKLHPIQQWLLLLALISFVVAANVWYYTDFIPSLGSCR